MTMFFTLTKNMSKIVNSSPYKNYINFISVPFNFIEKYNILNYKKVINQNQKMKQELLKEKIKEQEIQILKEEQKDLNQILKIKDTYQDYQKKYAKITTRNKMYWYNTITINKGTKDGIKKQSPVLTDKGLIGEIESVTKNFSTVKLITSNKENKISIRIKEKTYQHATIIGYKYPYLKAELTNGQNIKKGQKVTTSGLGNIPKNIPIGKVEKIEKDKYEVAFIAYIKPYQDMNNITYVGVLTKWFTY